MGERGDPGGKDHGLAEIVGRLVDGFADMQSHSDAQRLIGMALTVGGKGTLSGDRAQRGPPRARKGNHEAVAKSLHLNAVVSGDLMADDFVVNANELVSTKVAQLLV